MKTLLLSGALLLASAPSLGQESRFTIPADLKPTEVPFIIEGNQVLFEVEADGPAGNRKFLAALNTGQGISGWMMPIWEQIGFVGGTPAHFKIGGAAVETKPKTLFMVDQAAYPDRQLLAFFFTHKVEGIVGADILANFDVMLDYAKKTLTLAAPGTLPHEGEAVPIHVRPDTGDISVDVTVDGISYPMAIDTGGAYSWIRPSTAATWLKAHPDWARNKGAVGQANFWMEPVPTETEGTLIRIPEMLVGPVKLDNASLFGTGPNLGGLFGVKKTEDMFDGWQKEATPGPVIGWLGTNILRHYRITIDYVAHMSWWKKLSDFDPHELDQVGLTLVYDKGHYSVGGIVAKHGRPTVSGVEKGDRIVAVDDKPAEGWSRDDIFAALGGKPGDMHRITLERKGKSFTVPLPVTAF